MARSRIGPLALESPLGGRGSQIFRAVHIQQKLQVAVRIFSVPLGMTPEAKRDFAEEMEQLKKLRHNGIVRCFGGGFDQRDAYLVYELVDGESLDKLLDRRQRLPWEVVLDYGIQLSEALEAAHQQRRIHGRLRPDKILVDRDGSRVRIGDFARGWSANNLLQRNAQPQELAYQAPECLEGEEASLEVASDLYSLGAVLYHALTGRCPFQGKTLEELRQSIVTHQLPAVASIVFDCPVWLNAIIEQLLDKDPARRPYTAAAVALALKEAQKRATQGISVAQHAVSGFSPLQMRSVDRAEAERVLGHKPKRVKKEVEGPSFYERPWFLVVCILCILLGIGWIMMPLNARQLRERAEKLLVTNDPVDWNDARDKYLLALVERFPNTEDADWAQEQLDTIEMNNAERKMERNAQRGRVPENEGEIRYQEARRYERFGDRITAYEKYKSIVNLMKDEEKERPFVNLARRQIREIERNPMSYTELQKFLTTKLDEADKLSDQGNVIESTKIWESIVNLYNGNQELKTIVEKAQSKLRK